MLESKYLLPSCVLLVPTFINKTLMVLLLCLIFIGQSMASMTMFYTMTSMQNMAAMPSMSSSHHNMAASDRSANQMSNMVNISDCNEDVMTTTACPTMTTEDCCAQECDCSISGCSTITAFSALMNYPPAIAISNKIVSFSAFIASNPLTSLYRPPIQS